MELNLGEDPGASQTVRFIIQYIHSCKVHIIQIFIEIETSYVDIYDYHTLTSRIISIASE